MKKYKVIPVEYAGEDEEFVHLLVKNPPEWLIVLDGKECQFSISRSEK